LLILWRILFAEFFLYFLLLPFAGKILVEGCF